VLVATGDGGSAAPTGRAKEPEAAQGGHQPERVEDLSKFPHFPLTGPEWKPVDESVYPGLKYWDVKEGAGEPCPAGATVTIHYTGWTVDGNVFDSSHKRGQPATFPLGDLIQGWQAGIPGMKPGGVRRLLIPYPLAYGERGRPPSIPPRATLVFEIELISFKS
jgi:FKBP-type peptidyl-prolyl cis-trans isomerase